MVFPEILHLFGLIAGTQIFEKKIKTELTTNLIIFVLQFIQALNTSYLDRMHFAY